MATSCPIVPQANPAPSIQGLSQITSGLYIGNAAAATNKLVLSSNQITSVVTASEEIVGAFFENIEYVHVPVTDTPCSYIYGYFDAVADHIHGVRMRNGRTLLHCAAGVSRSASLGLAYLMKYHTMSLLDAYTWTKLCRPIIRPNDGFWKQLIHYEFKLFNKNTVHMINSPIGTIPDVYEKEINLMM